MAAKGGTVADITVGDCVELLEVADQVAARLHGGAHSPLFYQLLRTGAAFPATRPRRCGCSPAAASRPARS